MGCRPDDRSHIIPGFSGLERVMPLVGYHLIGFDNRPISFTVSDQKLLTRSEHRERTERFFARTPHNFNLIFHNTRPLVTDYDLKRYGYMREQWTSFLLMFGRVGGHSRWKLQWSKGQQTHIFLRGNTTLFNPNAINVVYMSNVTGLPVIPFTPHIMAHRLGHMHLLNQEQPKLLTFLQHWGNLVLSNYFQYTIMADVCHSKMVAGDLEHRLYAWHENAHIDALWWNAIFKYLTTTRAGRQRQAHGWEYIPEWFAQYVNLGKLNLPPELPRELDLDYIYQNDRAVFVPVPTKVLSTPHKHPYSTQPFARRIEQYFEGILCQWRGELIVT